MVPGCQGLVARAFTYPAIIISPMNISPSSFTPSILYLSIPLCIISISYLFIHPSSLYPLINPIIHLSIFVYLYILMSSIYFHLLIHPCIPYLISPTTRPRPNLPRLRSGWAAVPADRQGVGGPRKTGTARCGERVCASLPGGRAGIYACVNVCEQASAAATPLPSPKEKDGKSFALALVLSSPQLSDSPSLSLTVCSFSP